MLKFKFVILFFSIFFLGCHNKKKVSIFNYVNSSSLGIHNENWFRLEKTDSLFENQNYRVNISLKGFEFDGYLFFRGRQIFLTKSQSTNNSDGIKFVDLDAKMCQYYETIGYNQMLLLDTFNLEPANESIYSYLLKFPFSSTSSRYRDRFILFFSVKRGIVATTYFDRGRSNNASIDFVDFNGDSTLLNHQIIYCP